MATNEEVATQLRTMKGRLDYAVLQLQREARFLTPTNPGNRRFYRAFETTTEVRDELALLLKELP